MADKMNRTARIWYRVAVAYMIWLCVLTVLCLTSGFPIFPGHPRFSVATKNMLQNMLTAQELYYSEHKTYTRNLADLTPDYRIAHGFTVIILGADNKHWAAVARHEGMEGFYVFDSEKGLLR